MEVNSDGSKTLDANDLKKLNPEALKCITDYLLTACRDFEPWADMMYWTGGGDHGAYDFPLNMDDVERIDITRVPAEGSDEAVTSSGQV